MSKNDTHLHEILRLLDKLGPLLLQRQSRRFFGLLLLLLLPFSHLLDLLQTQLLLALQRLLLVVTPLSPTQMVRCLIQQISAVLGLAAKVTLELEATRLVQIEEPLEAALSDLQVVDGALDCL